MKTLSLTQPWATLIAVGAKRIETRGWMTRYRGPIAIHAAKTMPRDARELCFEEPFRQVLAARDLRPSDLPRGVVIAVADLIGVVPTSINGYTPPVLKARLTEVERAFGDFSQGRAAWILANVRTLREPIPAKGALSLWDWTPPTDLEDQLVSVVPMAHVAEVRA